jgi:hypothetical protein
MSTKHTQGPWEVKSIVGVYAPYGRLVAVASTPISDGVNNDACLIAASPDLLSCLIEMVEVHDEPCHLDHHGCCQSHFLDDVNEGGCRVANARAAITKATGDQS